ncbi:MAG: hypothetical protein NVSMB25_19430 [Thermoleophilaceae bacterium]
MPRALVALNPRYAFETGEVMLVKRRVMLLMAIALLASSAAAPAGAKRPSHHGAPKVKFVAWGVRAVVDGQEKVTINPVHEWTHCQAHPIIRITANFRWSQIKNGSEVSASWYHDGQFGLTTRERLSYHKGLKTFAFYIANTNPGGFVDGLYAVIVRVNGKPIGEQSMHVTTTSQC